MSFLMPSFTGILRHTRCREGSVSIAQRFAIGPYEREQLLESLQGTWFLSWTQQDTVMYNQFYLH